MVLMQMQSFFVSFLLLLLCLEISSVKADCDQHDNKERHHKHTTKTTSISSKITTPPLSTTTKISSTQTLQTWCDDTECEESGKQFCLCENNKFPNHSSHWSVPAHDTCQSIGCLAEGKACYCNSHIAPYGRCNCSDVNQCDKTAKTVCRGLALSNGCYCIFGEKAITTDYNYHPASNNCSDVLREIGDHNGRYHCSAISCNCDPYGNCVCLPPKNKNPQTTKPKQCNSVECQKRSFEYCECTTFDYCYNNGTCTSDVVFKNLPKSGICAGMLNISYQCHNVGQKCSCVYDCNETQTKYKGSNTTNSFCSCVDVDSFNNYDGCDNCSSQSSSSCICTYGELAIRIDNAPKDCKVMERSMEKHKTKFDACPYRDGQDCTCKRNPNTHEKGCICQNTLKRIPPFSLINTASQYPFNRPKPIPNACCNNYNDCVEYSELYCNCTNYANNTYVEKLSRSAIANLPNDDYDQNAVEKICNAFGHPPDTSCHPYGYKAYCVLGFCNLNPINISPNVGCKHDKDCIKYSKLYCYCTNYVNNTYVEKVSRSAIANLPEYYEFDQKGVEILCNAFGHPPHISCHPFGYEGICVFGFCDLKLYNLYESEDKIQ